MKPEPELLLDDHRGILEDPEHDNYWDVWMEVCDDAVLTSEGTTYTLYQDGALWLIPDGMEWDDKEDWWVWSS